MKYYPKATEKRLPFHDPVMHKTRKKFFAAAGKNFALLQLLFFALFGYVFGSLYQQATHTHNIHIVFVDYDGGAIGQAIRKAYSGLQARTFPTLVEKSAAEYANPGTLENAVCRTRFWAALYTSAGASDRLHDALTSNESVVYDPTDVMTYIWNEARYSAVVDPVVSSNLQTLSSAARVAYSTSNGTGEITSLSSPAALSAFAQPWQLGNQNIQPTTQGSRAIYNTLVIILIVIQEFFYLGTINGLYQALQIYVRVHPVRIIIIRNLNSLTYCLVGSVCTAGAIWAFRSGWDVDANQFVLTWMTLWLFAHLNFATMDVFTIWLQPAYVPMALITWMITNVTSILLPFELSPAFYKIGYMLPAHEVYQVLLDIWSGGCNPQLYYALPIMFSWWVLAVSLSALGVFRRCHYATLGQEQQEKQFQERLDAAMEFERKREREAQEASTAAEAQMEKKVTSPGEQEDTDAEVQRELAEVISRTNSRIRREQRRESRTCSFGPAFSVAFGNESDFDVSEAPK